MKICEIMKYAMEDEATKIIVYDIECNVDIFQGKYRDCPQYIRNMSFDTLNPYCIINPYTNKNENTDCAYIQFNV